MRFVMAFVWSFLLVAMLNYVAGSIANVGFRLPSRCNCFGHRCCSSRLMGESFPEGEVADH